MILNDGLIIDLWREILQQCRHRFMMMRDGCQCNYPLGVELSQITERYFVIRLTDIFAIIAVCNEIHRRYS